MTANIFMRVSFVITSYSIHYTKLYDLIAVVVEVAGNNQIAILVNIRFVPCGVIPNNDNHPSAVYHQRWPVTHTYITINNERVIHNQIDIGTGIKTQVAIAGNSYNFV